MKKRLLLLITAITLIVAQQGIPAFAGENTYTQVLFPIEDQWSEGPSFSKGKTHTKENSDYYYYELYPEQIMEANHFSLGGLPFDLAMLYPEIDLSDEEFEEETILKAPPGGGPPIGGVPLNDGLIFLLIFSVLFISYKFLNNTHIMKHSIPSLRLQSGKQSSTKNRKAWIASSFLLAMTLLLCTSNLQAQILKAKPVNKFIPNDQWYSWSEADGGTDAFTGATINVLENDELGACTQETIIVRITQAPTKGTAVVIGDNDTRGLTKNRILYTVNHGDNKNFTESGQDVLRYEIECNGTTSDEVEVLINISDQPDNIVWEGCFIDPQAMAWGIKPAKNLGSVYNYTPALVGDLDGKGNPEIVTSTERSIISGVNHAAKEISIFLDGGDGTRIDFSTKQAYQCFAPGAMAIAKVKITEDVFIGIIVVAETDGFLRAYKLDEDNTVSLFWDASVVNSTLKNTAKWNSSGVTKYATSVAFADFNNDGYVEVYANNRIFDAATGKLLCYGTENRGASYNAVTTESSMTIAADVLGDANLELLAGNQVYEVSILDREDVSKNSMKVVSNVTPPIYTGSSRTRNDGLTQAVDINNDGQLDVLVGCRTANDIYSLYIWDPRKKEVMAQKTFTTSNTMGIPFIGDIDGDGFPEIVVISSNYSAENSDSKYNRLRALKYNESQANISNRLVAFWEMSHADSSGQTGVTLFDFNQDGTAELVYRDEQYLRVMNGSGKDSDGKSMIISGKLNMETATIQKYVSTSYTGYEYATVADVDGDGQAEIIVAGGTTPTGPTYEGDLIIYKSNGSPWAWARPVWNQYAYNPVYVNDDLTIPSHPMNLATVFVDKDAKEHRPYNNFLQQATQLNNEGKMFQYGPDLLFDSMEGEYGSGVIYTENGANLDVTIYVLNQGDIDFISPLQVSAYKIDAGTLSSVYTGSFDVTIEKADTKVVNFSIPLSDLPAGINPYTGIQLRLNDKDFSLDNDPPTPVGAAECRYYNNYYPSGLYIALPAVACEGEDIILQIYPQDGTYTYKWYEAATSDVVLSETYTYTAKKDNSQLQILYVDVYQGETKINTDGRYEVKIYSRPKELVWTGAARNHDWHNTGNWYEPAEVTPKAYLIPRKCTNVLIPDGLSYYADLSKTTTTVFSEAQCADIRFEFGGEVARTDLLNYDRAFVQYNFGYYEDGKNDLVVKQGFVKKQGTDTYTPSHMARDRYYALSAPLNKIVTGDFGLGGKPNTWQQAFVPTQTANDTWVGEFKAPANTNDIELNQSLGYAIALWAAGDNNGEMGEDRDLDNGYQSGLDGLEGIIEIPYFENKAASDLHRLHEYDKTNKVSKFGYYYYQQPNFPQVQGMYGSIARADEAYRFIFDEAVKNKEAFTITVPAVSEIMIGNPTMSTMDFDAFYAANTDKMENYYRLFENQVFKTYVPTGDPAKTAPIAPMQAFFIKTKGTVGSTVDLVYPFDASITRAKDTAHGLRSADGGSRIKFGMTEIESGMTMQINASQGDYTSQISLVLNEPERKNIEQLFYRYADNTPQLYLKDEAGKRNAVQFEGRAEKEIPLGIQFEKATAVTLNFSNIEDLPLESLSLVDTKTGTETNLLKTSSYTFTHDTDGERFVLRVGRLRNVTGIDEFEAEATLNVYPEGKQIVVSSNQSIVSIEVYDTQGRLVIQQTTADGLIINDSGIYIVRVTLANGERKAVKVTL